MAPQAPDRDEPRLLVSLLVSSIRAWVRASLVAGFLVGACTLGARDADDLSGQHGGGAGGADGGGGAGNCSAGTLDCDGVDANGCETAVDKDPKNCGACGKACPSTDGKTPTCTDGACGVSNCSAPMADCDGDGSCETDTSTSTDHCGYCDYPCALANAKPTCDQGCQIDECNAGFASCDGVPSNGCETPLNTATDCGNCGATCTLPNATASCETDGCKLTACTGGFADCDGMPETGCESNVQTDPKNCGKCGTQCTTGQVCQAGKCVVSSCTAPMADCDTNPGDCETNTDTSVLHCGFCKNPCALANANAACGAGKCSVASCKANWGNCDGIAANGCETQLGTATNCKSCGDQCSGGQNVAAATCVTSGCQLVCNAGFGNCNASATDGCESQLSNDPLHCGSCSNDCTAKAPQGKQAGCASGVCTFNCAAGTADCDGNGSCETNVATSPTNCGQCGHSCSGTTCAGGFCLPDLVVPGANLTSVDRDSSATTLVFTRGGAGGGVYRVNKSTKAVTTIVANQNATAVDVVTTYTFFTDADTGAKRVLSGGGAATLLGAGLGGKQLDSNGNDVFFTATAGLMKVDAGGGPVQIFDPSPGTFGLRYDSGPGLVFWTVPAAGEVRYSPSSAPAVQKVATAQGEPSFVKVDATYVFWTATTDGAIRRANKPSTGVTTVFSGLQSPYALAQDGTELFWASKASGGLWKGLKTGGTPTKLADSLTNVLCLEVDGTHVYWIDSDGMKRVPR